MLSPPAGAKVLGLSRRRIRARLQDARIRVKLGLILIIPTVAILVLGADRLVQHGQQALDIEQIRSLATLSAEASAVTQEVQHERMAAAAFLANPSAHSDQYLPQIQRTDLAITGYKALRAGLGDVPTTVADRLRDIDQQISVLEATRQQVLTRADVTVSAVVLRYGAMAEGLVAFRESLGQIAGDTALGDTLRAAAALSRMKLQVAQEQAIAFVALRAGTLDEEQLTAFLSTLIGQQESLDAFMLAAAPEQRAFVSATLTGDAINLADTVANYVIRSTGRAALITADDAARSLGAVVDLTRWAEERVDRDVLAAAASQRNTVIWQVVGDMTAVILVIAIALAFALMLSRSLARSLNRLRLGALRVAHRDLPETVARLSDHRTLGDHSPSEVAAQVADPIGLSSMDEIGDVARAFNVVHREAVRVAAEQAGLYTSVSVMFLNLARRSQSLVDQMIAHLDDMEQNEEDPKRLGRLFRLDHLATRMRRNDENLLVLAGADSSPARREDGVLADILRAAQAEIDNYARVEFGPIDVDALVLSQAVNDVVRLLAELLDNGTRFSPPDAAVLVSARQYADSVLIQIEDSGVGMTVEQTVFFNTRLASPPKIDIAAFRMMGLAVVGRLAARYRIQIELHSRPGEGTTVYIKLPGPIVILGRNDGGYDPAAGGPRPLAVPAGPTAAQWLDAVSGTPMGGPTPGQAPTSPQRNNAVPYATAPPSGHWAEHPPASQSAASPSAANDDTAEMPIYREVEAIWFRDSHSFPVPAAVPTARDPSTWDGDPGQPVSPHWAAAPFSASTPVSTVAPPAPTSGSWQTAADEGWRAARSASEEPVRTRTRNGLPKRVPQAQLVPGGVAGASSVTLAQRNPDDVRGLLSAYHRGVQRGRGVKDDR